MPRVSKTALRRRACGDSRTYKAEMRSEVDLVLELIKSLHRDSIDGLPGIQGNGSLRTLLTAEAHMGTIRESMTVKNWGR